MERESFNSLQLLLKRPNPAHPPEQQVDARVTVRGKQQRFNERGVQLHPGPKMRSV
jgi:hypothetical protein